MMKHTKGPWKQVAGWIGTQDGETIGYVSEHRNRKRRPKEEQEANERLVQKAPELYDMLESCIHWMVYPPTSNSDRYLVSELVKRAASTLKEIDNG